MHSLSPRLRRQLSPPANAAFTAAAAAVREAKAIGVDSSQARRAIHDRRLMATFVAEAMAIGKEPLPSMVILGSRTEFFDRQVNGTDGLLLFALSRWTSERVRHDDRRARLTEC